MAELRTKNQRGGWSQPVSFETGPSPLGAAAVLPTVRSQNSKPKGKKPTHSQEPQTNRPTALHGPRYQALTSHLLQPFRVSSGRGKGGHVAFLETNEKGLLQLLLALKTSITMARAGRVMAQILRVRYVGGDGHGRGAFSKGCQGPPDFFDPNQG